jgi:hypothetical protein
MHAETVPLSCCCRLLLSFVMPALVPSEQFMATVPRGEDVAAVTGDW